MSRFVTWLAVFCVLATAITAKGVRAEEPEALTRILDRHWRSIESHSPKVGVRECVSLSLDSAAENWHPERIGPALAMALEMRDVDSTSRFYGNYRWRMDDPRVFDPNAVEFITSQAVLLRKHFADHLTPEARALLDQLLEHSILGIERHQVPITYTNIYLIKTWNLVALGETLQRPALTDTGYQMLDDWIAHTRANGITEYLSPTYYGVDLDALGLLARDAQRADGRAKATAALRYLWADIAANWYEPGRRLGGAHSRDYDYLTGRGELDVHLSLAGWLDGTKLPTRTLARYSHWQPTEEFRKLALDLPRVVSQRWGSDDRHRADQYVGRKFSIGSAGASYASMDKPLVVNLPGGPAMPQVSFFMDARGDAYGKTRVVSGGTHQKSLHLVPLIASAQRDAEVLMLAADDPKTRKAAKLGDSATCLLSHIVLPAKCELWDVEPIAAKADQERSWPGDLPLFLRCDDVVVGIRVVLALDTLGIDAPMQLVDDGLDDTLDGDVRRLTCVHAENLIEGTPTADGTGVVAVWMRAAEGLDEARFAEFRKAFAEAIVSRDVKDSTYRVTVQGDKGEMSVALDMSTHEALPSRGGNPMPRGPLVVNGRDVGEKVLRVED